MRIIQSPKTLSSLSRKFFEHLDQLDAGTLQPTRQHCHLLTAPQPNFGALQQERAHYKELSEDVKQINKENLEAPESMLRPPKDALMFATLIIKCSASADPMF